MSRKPNFYDLPEAGDSSERSPCNQFLPAVLAPLINDALLSDVTMVVGGESFYAHRVLLASWSPVFRSMLTGPFSEAQSKTIELHDIEAPHFLRLLQYMYTGQSDLTLENSLPMLALSNRFEINQLEELCTNVVTEQITIQSCATFAHAAEKFNCTELRDSMLSFLVAHFERVSHTDGFLELQATFLLDVLQSNAIVVDKEENTFRTLMRWLEHDPIARAPSLPLLLVHVRFPLMRPRFLFHFVEKQPLVMQCACMQGLLLEAYRYHALIEDDEESAAEAASSSSSSSSSATMLHANAGASTSVRLETALSASTISSASMIAQQQQQQQHRRRSSKDLILISLSAAAAAAATANSNSALTSVSDHAGLLAFPSVAGGTSSPASALTNHFAADADGNADVGADAALALSAEEAAELATAMAASLLPDRFRERGLEHVIFGPTSGTFYNCSSSISHNHPLSNLRRKNDKYWLPSDAESAQIGIMFDGIYRLTSLRFMNRHSSTIEIRVRETESESWQTLVSSAPAGEFKAVREFTFNKKNGYEEVIMAGCMLITLTGRSDQNFHTSIYWLEVNGKPCTTTWLSP